MNDRISLDTVGHGSSLLLAATFVVCVAFVLAFPPMAMYQTWLGLLPGFDWLR